MRINNIDKLHNFTDDNFDVCLLDNVDSYLSMRLPYVQIQCRLEGLCNGLAEMLSSRSQKPVGWKVEGNKFYMTINGNPEFLLIEWNPGSPDDNEAGRITCNSITIADSGEFVNSLVSQLQELLPELLKVVA